MLCGGTGTCSMIYNMTTEFQYYKAQVVSWVSFPSEIQHPVLGAGATYTCISSYEM